MTCVTHAGLTRDVRDYQTQSGSATSRVFATFKHLLYLTKWTLHSLKNCCESIFDSLLIDWAPVASSLGVPFKIQSQRETVLLNGVSTHNHKKEAHIYSKPVYFNLVFGSCPSSADTLYLTRLAPGAGIFIHKKINHTNFMRKKKKGSKARLYKNILPSYIH